MHARGAPPGEVAQSRRSLMAEGSAIGLGVAAYGFVFGVSAAAAGLSPLEAAAMSGLVFAGAAQFSAIAGLGAGAGLGAVVLVTTLVIARNAVYGAALAPWLTGQSSTRRAVMAHFLSDATFALSLAHFRRLGRPDEWGYWWVAVVATFLPWNAATLAGVAVGGAIPDPASLGLDVVFPAAMAGTAIGLVDDGRSLVAVSFGAVLAIAVALLSTPVVGMIAGGLAGALLGQTLIPARGEKAGE